MSTPAARRAGLNSAYSPRVNPNGPFKFPLEDDGDYKGRISFKAYKTESNTLGELFQGFVTGAPQTTVDQQVARNQATSDPGLSTTKRQIPQRVGSGRTCSLYLPQSIQFADRIEYTNVDLGIVGAATAQGLASGLTGAEIASKALGATLPDFESVQDAFAVGVRTEAAQVAALRGSRRVSGAVAGAIETTTGVTLNPNRRSTLRGVGLRQFRFAFKMIPTSQDEAEMVKGIVQFFREEMYPEARFISNVSAAYRFPSKFDIKLSYDGKKVATGILPCFLESVDVVYNPNAMAFHTDGNPQETDISLNFVEERTLSKYDITNEGY